MNTAPKVVARFFKKTNPGPDFDGIPCLLWTASHATKNGYGRFSDGQRFWVAHQYAYALAHGGIRPGVRIGHRCPNRLCVNHLHLTPITDDEVRRRAHLSRTYQLTCNHGHLWTRDNMYMAGQKHRKCRKCQRFQSARWYRSKKAAL